MQSSYSSPISAYPNDVAKEILFYFEEDLQTIGNIRLACKSEKDAVDEVLPYLISAFFKNRCNQLQTQGEIRAKAIQQHYAHLCKIGSVSGHPDEMYDKMERMFRLFLCRYQRIFPKSSLCNSTNWKDYSVNCLYKITRNDAEVGKWTLKQFSEIYDQSIEDPANPTNCLFVTKNPCIFNGMSIFRLHNCELMLQHLQIISKELSEVNSLPLSVFLKGDS